MSGITYYKLSKDIYPGDTTKGCGLTGPEIDANFHFLRGYDIKSGDLNPENGVITLYRLNGDKIEIKGLAELLSGLTDFNLDESYYDPSEGVLHLFVNGEEQSAITGFFTHADIHVDCTLEGDGSEENLLRISKEFIDGIHNEVKDAVDRERGEREEADKNLNDKISYEIERAQSSERTLGESLLNEKTRAESAEGALLEKIETEQQRAKEAENSLAENIGSETERAKGAEAELGNSIEEIKEDVAGLDSAFTESLSEINSEISAITDSISELEEKVVDVTLTEDIVISESSPLYPFISGVWEDNIIPSGTTFTDFVKTLCSADTRMIYYIDTPLSDIDDVVTNFDDLKKLPSGTATTIISGTMGAHIIGVALPKPRNLLSVISTQNGFTQRITDKFFVNPTRDVISEGIVYTLYYYKINVGLRSSDNFTITLS